MGDHRNIPFFVPFAGCPNRCVFCAQEKITGQSIEEDNTCELKALEALLESTPRDGRESRIAFFGGSFTAIPRERMERLLAKAYEYIKKGIASGIRISTRPDCINEEILSLLAEYGVCDIELGIQSTDDKVLAASGRGHDAKCSFRAAELITGRGFTLGGQMMVGLPGATPESELATARDIVAMGARESRIYPTVVFAGTELYRMAISGEYTPISDEEAVVRSASCFRVFSDSGVKVLRVGLHASEETVSAPFGATHPSIGELVQGQVYADIISERVGDAGGRVLEITVKKSDISMLCGHGGRAIKAIEAATNAAAVKVIGGDRKRFDPLINFGSVK